MLKRWFALMLALVMLFSLAACGDDKVEDKEETKSTQTRKTRDDSKKPDKMTVTITTNPPTTTTTAPTYPANSIDPFAGIRYTVTGISPYCTIAINNLGCSDEAQRYVSYSLDKEYYANGETAVVTATLDNEEYSLRATQTTYVVADQPEYITAMDGLDLTFFNEELEGYITAKRAEPLIWNDIFGVHSYDNGYKSVDKVDRQVVYLTSIKKIREQTNEEHYNALNMFYYVEATTNDGQKKTAYVNIIAYDIVKYPDGTVKWGRGNPDAYGFTHQAGTEGLDRLIATTVSVHSANYNITKVE